eukprot:scaffold85535_cov37-Tisochrysis_lutea.AAC.2
MEKWEERAYHYCKEHLRSKGFPVSGLHLDPELVCRGIIVDTEQGNLLKADRFGYVRRGMHGTKQLSDEKIRAEYSQEAVDLRDSRWVFLNTMFSVSEGCLYAQLVDRLDSGALLADAQPPFDAVRCSSYSQLYQAVSKALYKAHVASRLKDEVMQDPLSFVHLDPATCEALLDQRDAGKKLALVTNSDWVYTQKVMSSIYNPFLPAGMDWTNLFDLVVVSACKPEFFTTDRRPVYELATEDGYLRQHFRFEEGKIFAGGNARMLQKCFQVTGEEILYVGDHIFSDVNMAKKGLRWRTCLIMQELEKEVEGLSLGLEKQNAIRQLFSVRNQHAAVLNRLRNDLTKRLNGRDGAGNSASPPRSAEDSRKDIETLQGTVEALNDELDQLLREEGGHVNKYWGYMSRAGFADTSHLMRQIQKYADIYTSRVSNFLPYTPYALFSSPRHALAHDMDYSQIFVKSTSYGAENSTASSRGAS